MTDLFHLLTDLALDPKKQTIYIDQPNFLMNKLNLSELEQVAMMSRKGDKIADTFIDKQFQLATTLADPGPDPLPDPDPFPLPDPDPSPPVDISA